MGKITEVVFLMEQQMLDILVLMDTRISEQDKG